MRKLLIIIAIFSCLAANAGEAVLLHEDFESWNGSNPAWLPAQWALQGSESYSWHVTQGDPLMKMQPQGKYCIGIENDRQAKDERLTSYYIANQYGGKLSFRLYYDPAYLFKLDAEHVDFSRYEFTNQETAVNLEVWLNPEEGESRKIFDLVQQYAGYTLKELLGAMPPNDMQLVEVDIPQGLQGRYSFTFRYVGTNGTYMYLDDIKLSVPQEQSLYRFPQGMLYWGSDCTTGWHTLSFEGRNLGLLPVNTDLTYTAVEVDEPAFYSWTFKDDVCGNEITAEGPELQLQYHPHHGSASLQRNNWYAPVEMLVTKPGTLYDKYSGGLSYIQAGGAPEYEVAGNIRRYGLLPFDMRQHPLTVSEDVSNSSTDAIVNIMESPAAPLVLTGLWLNARGSTSLTTTLTAHIYGIDTTGKPDTGTPMATAQCNASQILHAASAGSYGYMTIPFTFHSPVVIDSAFAVSIEGLNSDDELLLPAYAKIAEEHIYAINLDGYYPWLTTEEETELSLEAGELTISLDSYYNGAELAVTCTDGSELPSWLTAWCEGRYDKTKLHLCAEATPDGHYLPLMVSAPGVELSFTLNHPSSVPMTVTSSAVTYYTLQGTHIARPTAPGIYLAITPDGLTHKILIR